MRICICVVLNSRLGGSTDNGRAREAARCEQSCVGLEEAVGRVVVAAGEVGDSADGAGKVHGLDAALGWCGGAAHEQHCAVAAAVTYCCAGFL